jgi:dCTP deaminase
MLIVISGPSTVGKSYCIDFLCARYRFRTLVPFTSRPPRNSEAEGVQYHFRTKKEILSLSRDRSKGYWDEPLEDGNIYGYTDDVDMAIRSSGYYAIQASAKTAKLIRSRHPKHGKLNAQQGDRSHPEQLILVFMDFPSKDAAIASIRARFGPDESARVRHIDREQALSDEFDIKIVAADGLSASEQLAQRLQTDCKLPLPEPFAPRSVGALSESDIRGSLRSHGGIRVFKENEDCANSVAINGWSMDLTLGSNFWRVRKGLVRDMIDADEDSINKMFVRHSVEPNAGISLKPGEFILATTAERIVLPRDLVGMFTGRSTYAAFGITVELSQTVLHPGHNSPVRIQICNHLPNDIILYPGIALVQVVFFGLINPPSEDYTERRNRSFDKGEVVTKFYKTDATIAGLRKDRPKGKRQINWAGLVEASEILAMFFTLAYVVGVYWHLEQIKQVGLLGALILWTPTVVSRIVKAKEHFWR